MLVFKGRISLIKSTRPSFGLTVVS